MQTVNVKKSDVIDTLEQNRADHKAIFEEANANYRQKVVNAMRARADEIEQGGEIKVHFDLPKPEDHTEDFDEALQTLGWEQRDTLDLNRHDEFAQWMLNKWHWDRSFLANTTSYTASARR